MPLVAAIIAGLALGFGLAWVLKPAATGTPRAPVVAYQPSPAAEPLPDSAPEKPAPPANDEMPQTPEPLPFAGSATLAGIARFEDGTPCPGLPLVVGPAPSGNFAPVVNPNALTADERVEHFERQGAPSQTPPLKTDADGRFEMRDVAEGEYQFMSDDPERVLEPLLARGRTGEEIELTVRRQLFASFEFELESGEKLQKAYFMLYNEGKTVAAGYDWKPGKTYRLKPGACKATVMGGPHDLWKAEQEFDAPRDGFSGPVKIILKGTNALIVKRTNPEPYYGTLGTFVVSADTVKEPLTDRTFREHLRSWGGDTNSNPFVMKDLKPGRYIVHWAFGPAAILARAEVEYRGGLQEFEHRLPDLRPEDHFQVRVLGPDGEPVEGARIDLSVQSGTSHIWPSVDRGRGSYWVRRIAVPNFFYPGQEASRSEYILSAKCKHGVRVVRCPIDVTDEVVIRYGRMGKLTVLVENAPTGKAEFEVLVAPRAGDINQLMDSGSSEVRRLAARLEFSLVSGPVTLVVTVKREDDTSPRRRVVIRREFELAEGEQQERIDMSNIRPLIVIMPEGVRFLTMREGNHSEQRQVGETRRVEFLAVGAGEIRLDAATGSMTVSTPVVGDVHFNPLPYNALVPTLAYAKALLTEIGFIPDDAIRQINNAPVTGTTAEVFALFRGAAESGDVNLRVQRGGQWISLTVSAAQWKELKDYYFTARRLE